MSMLSAQIDKLRALADRMDGIVPNTPDELRDAADTIWQLRNDLQRANAENARLRELVRDYEHCTMHADCSRCEHDGKLSMHCPLSPCFPDSDELCEMGIEV